MVVGEVALLDALADAAGRWGVAECGVAFRQTEALAVVACHDDRRGVFGELVLQGVRVLQLSDFGWRFDGVEGELFIHLEVAAIAGEELQVCRRESGADDAADAGR